MKFLSFEMHKEKEVVIWLVDTRISDTLASSLYTQLDLGARAAARSLSCQPRPWGWRPPAA